MIEATMTMYEGKQFRTYELPYGAEVEIEVNKTSEGKKYKCTAVFQHMDGMYGLRYDKETNEPLIFSGLFEHIKDNRFRLVEE